MELLELLLRRRARVGAALAVLVLAAVVALVLSGSGGQPPHLEPRVETEPARAERVPYDGRSPRLGHAGDEHRVLVALPRPALGERRDLVRLDAAARRRYVASLRRESAALRSALQARGVRLRDVMTFERAWHGFAATIRARDLARLTSIGVRTRPIRRFFPAVSEPVPDPRSLDAPPAPDSRAVVALLAGGAAGDGYDAVDGDDDPAPGADPRDVGRPEVSGTALARVLEDLGVRVRPVRVAALRPAAGGVVEEHARTDELLAGLERAVDPNGDGDPGDHLAVALIGVNAPYAGFADAPEAEAAAAARRLGTTVVAPAGHEGRGSGRSGTIGSPGAADEVVTVGALQAPGPPATVELRVGGLRIRRAALLGGTPPGGRLTTGAGPGQLAVVPAGEQPAAAALKAVSAGAAAVVVAEARPGRALPSVPAGMVPAPVFGVTGAAAKALLELPPGLEAATSHYAAAPPGRPDTAAQALASSRGPTLAGLAKPEWLADGAAAGVAGAGVAAARVAAALARGSEPTAAGARPAPRARRVPRPRPVPIGPLVLDRDSDRVSAVRFTVGAFERRDPLGGSGTTIVPAQQLELTLTTETGRTVRRLTPPGGERGLLPGEYAYTLPRRLLGDLPAGRYRFVVRAQAPRQRRPSQGSSPAFSVA